MTPALNGLLANPPIDGCTIPRRAIDFRVLKRGRAAKPALGWVAWVAGIVLLASLPVASNHPLAWAFWAVVVGATASWRMTKTDFSFLGTTLFTQRIILLGIAFAMVAAFQAVPWNVLFQVDGLPRTPFSVAPGASLMAALRSATYVIFFALVVAIARTPKMARQLITVMFYGVAAHALWALVALRVLGDIGLFFEKTAYGGMATGGFVSKNAFATFLGMGLVTGLALLSSQRSRKRLDAAGHLAILAKRLAIFAIITALLSTGSRMGILATVIAAPIALNAIPTRRVLLAGAILIAVATALGVIYGYMPRLEALGSDAITRFDLYRQVLEMISARPVTGFGRDTFSLAFQQFHAAPVTSEFVWDKAHSTYLTFWAESGLILGSLPILIGTMISARLWQNSRRTHRSGMLPRTALAALVLASLHALFDFSLEIQANMFLLVALVGAGISDTFKTEGRP